MITENLYAKDCIRTFTGIYINFLNPTLDMICIEDIAHALSMQCRFGGHLTTFYSVAQHSVHAAYASKHDNALQALMHDASEAYLLDIPRPIKNRLTNYKDIENKLMLLIAEKFGFEYPLSEETKLIDEDLLVWEWNHLMIMPNEPNVSCWSSSKSENKFLEAYKKYKSKAE